MKVKCLEFTDFGNPIEVLKIAYKDIQPPANNEVLVRMIARPINPSDLIPIWGSYAHRIPLPNILGYEGVGIVEEVGANVSRNLIGQRVLPLRGEGTWQELVKTSVDYTVTIPDTIDDFTAAQLYINPVTAWVICTEELKLKKGDTLLVNACGSAIGRLFIQMSKLLGFKIIAITRNEKHTDELRILGADCVINTSVDSLKKRVWDFTSEGGADAAIDSIGGTDGTELAFCVRPRGTFLTLGLLSGKQVDWTKIHEEADIQVQLFHLRHWNARVPTRKWQTTFQQLITLVQSQKLLFRKPEFFYCLHEIEEAITFIEKSKISPGKVMLTE